MNLYYDSASPSFGNCYQSALKAGYKRNTAKSMTVKRPRWLDQEKPGNNTLLQPDELLQKLATIIDDKAVNTRDRLRAIELLMKNNGMLLERKQVEAKLFHISLGSLEPNNTPRP